MSKVTVFISFSHDSLDHEARVRGLGASLSRDGCECRIDFYKDTDEDWPAWMTRQLRETDFVLCVVTKNYERRFLDKELPDQGLGVGWEAGLIRRLLYAKKLHNNRIFPVVFSKPDRDHIPLELQGYENFLLDGPVGYEALLRKLLKRPLYAPTEIGTTPDLATTQAVPSFGRPGDATSSSVGGTAHAGTNVNESENGTPGPKVFIRTWIAAAVLTLVAVVVVVMLMINGSPTLTVLPGPYETIVPSQQEQLDDPDNQWSLEIQIAGKKPQIVKPYWGQPLQIGQGGVFSFSNGLAISTGDEIRVTLRSSIANECVEWKWKVENLNGSKKPQEFTLEEKPFAPCQ